MISRFLNFDPFKAMFPIGLFMGAWGVGSWLLYGFKITETYPGTYHASIMIGGFLFLMAVGFLMTAIPAFTDTKHASPFELGFAILLSVSLAAMCVLNLLGYFHRVVLIELILLVVFGMRRFLKRRDDPPPSFIFVGFGILCGIFGMTLICLDDINVLPGDWSLMGHNLFFQGMMLSLVLGVGSRLIPALMGWEEMPLVQVTTTNTVSATSSKKLIALVVLMIFLATSFYVEAFISPQFGKILRALVTMIVAFSFWKLFKFPKEKTWLARWLWISGWCVVLGLWGYALVPSYGIHLLHLTFIGGFSLMTLMIATRVTIAHGSEEYELEEKSKALKWAGVLILAAMATRILAPFTMGAYRSHLGYASVAWIAGLAIWATVFLKRILVSSE